MVTFLIWFKMFDWLRMFDSTSFYIKLIMVTISDIMPFFLIFPIFLLTFGTPMYILQGNRGVEGAENAVLDEYLGNWVFDTLFNQYLLSLGEFGIDEFSNGPQATLCYIFFIFATFFTQVTALNMIIAIMGDTFGKVSEGHESHSRSMKIALLSDYVSLIRKDDKGKKYNSFLVLVTADREVESKKEWEGTVNMLRSAITKNSDELEHNLNKKIENVKDLVVETKSRQVMRDRETKKMISDMRKS